MDSAGQIVLSTQFEASQGCEELNPVGIDAQPTTVSVDADVTLYTYIRLPGGLALSRINREPLRTTLLVRSCYEEILDIIFRDDAPAAVVGGPGIGIPRFLSA
jgi:hypothetical protein